MTALDWEDKTLEEIQPCPTNKTQHKRLGKLIGELSEEQLDRSSASNPKRTVRSAILHGLHDEACHCGEIYLLGKMQVAARNGSSAGA